MAAVLGARGVVTARVIGKGPEGYREALEILVEKREVTRIERLAALLEEPLLVAGPPYVLGGQANVRYLTGLQSSNAAVLVEPDGDGDALHRLPVRGARPRGRGRDVRRGRAEPAPFDRRAACGTARSLFEEAHLPYAGYRALADAGVEAVADRRLVESLRAVKDEAEIAVMRRAGALSDEIFEALSQGAVQRPHGARARVVGRAELPRGRARKACPSRPSSRPARRRLRRTPSPATARSRRACSSSSTPGASSTATARTARAPSPSARSRPGCQEIYALCLEAQLAGLAAVGPGAHGRDVDAAARDVIGGAGLG